MVYYREIINSLKEVAMYEKYLVRIPEDTTGVTTKKIKGTEYVYFTYNRQYDPGKHYSIPDSTTIGKCPPDQPGKMFPNANFFRFFAEAELPEEVEYTPGRSSCQHIGAFIVIRKIIAEYGLDKIAEDVFKKNGGLLLDLAAYSIVTENNAAQYYPDYAWNHPVFTEGMKIYSDTKVGTFLSSSTADERIEFLDKWMKGRDHSETIYVSYDSTNKHCQAGDVEIAEMGHEKDKQGKPVFNYAIAYDHNNEEPLFYEDYPGSINDVSQLQYMLARAEGYGYKNVGFILERGYFSEPNIRYMDKHGFSFLMMVKGMKKLVRSIVLEVKGTFEFSRKHSIRSYKVSGITVRRKLFESDEEERYFHIYYNDGKETAEREKLESKIDRLAKYVKNHQGEKIRPGGDFNKYLELIYYHEGKEDECLLAARELYDVIDEDISLCGYFTLISSKKMTAEEALELYKSRDGSEKLFRGDKSYLGNKSTRTYTCESTETKILVEFIGLIIRNKIYTKLKEEKKKAGNKHNYMTVPAAIRELEKIELIRSPDGGYRMNYAVTATQKAILKAFGLDAANIKEQAKQIGLQLTAKEA